MSADWSQYSAQQINCLEALDFAVPLHQTHITKRYGVRLNTLTSCIRAGLARWVWLRDHGGPDISMPFATLTQDGHAVVRDWQRWNKSVSAKIASIDFTAPLPTP